MWVFVATKTDTANNQGIQSVKVFEDIAAFATPYHALTEKTIPSDRPIYAADHITGTKWILPVTNGEMTIINLSNHNIACLSQHKFAALYSVRLDGRHVFASNKKPVFTGMPVNSQEITRIALQHANKLYCNKTS